MLQNFFNEILKLEEDQKPLWGKMTPQHMVEHLILSVKMSNGKLTLKCINPPLKLPFLKKFLMSERPMPKLYVNPVIGEDLQPLKFNSLNQAQEKLKRETDDYEKFFSDNPDATPVNVTFGKLNKKEWDVFHQKHFTHHLKQFGLL